MTDNESTTMTATYEFTTGLKTFQAVRKIGIGRPPKEYFLDDRTNDNFSRLQSVFYDMKNKGWTWDMIADSISTDDIEISGSLVRKYTLGECDSHKIKAAVGIEEPLVTVPISRVKRTYKKRTGKAKRTRLCIDCHPALIERFDDMRHERTRAELLVDLLDLADGVGQLEV